jgi:hypothetical protein
MTIIPRRQGTIATYFVVLKVSAPLALWRAAPCVTKMIESSTLQQIAFIRRFLLNFSGKIIRFAST